MINVDVENQREIWNSYTNRGYLQSTIDPNDNKGIKVDYIDKWSKYYLKKFIVKKYKLDSVCEIGCGAGRLTNFLSEHVSQVYGTDIVDKLLQIAEQTKINKNIKYILCDGINYPTELIERKIDLIYTMWLMAGFSDDKNAVAMLKAYTENAKETNKFIFFEQSACETYIVNMEDGRFYKKVRSIDDYKKLFKLSGLNLIDTSILSEKGYGKFYNLLCRFSPILPKWFKVFNSLLLCFDIFTVKRKLKFNKFTDCVFICERMKQRETEINIQNGKTEENRNKLPPAIVFQGTTDIAAPIYYALHSKGIPVYYLIYNKDYLSKNIPAKQVIKIKNSMIDSYAIKIILQRIDYLKSKILVFPTNEISLNKCYPLAIYNGGNKFCIPGHISYPEKMNAFDITNKKLLFKKTSRLLKNLEGKNFKLAKTFILEKKKDLTRLSSSINCYPVIIKPSVKDFGDSFTSKYKKKLLIAHNYKELSAIYNKLVGKFGESFIIQEKIEFSEEFSWCGMRSNGYCFGIVLTDLIKLPAVGGTGVFSKIANNPKVERIARNILSLLDFEGICEDRKSVV